jgi:hypothetical protein
MFVECFYFVFGFFFALYIVILWRRRKSEFDYVPPTETEAICEHSRFYLNVFFLNRKEVLENIVRQKVSRSRPVIRALAKRLAVNLVSDEKLLERIGNDLKTSIPMRLALQGIIGTSNVVYQQSAFICVEVNITSVNLTKLLGLSDDSEQARKLEDFFDWVNMPQFKSLLESVVVRIASSKVMKQLPQTVKEKLQTKLLAEIEVVTLTDSEQGPFLVQTMQTLDERKNQP